MTSPGACEPSATALAVADGAVSYAQSALLVDVTPEARRATTVGIFSAVCLLGNAVGAVVFGYIARKLEAIQEGPRTLLDNTMLLHCSSMMAGARHDNDRLPAILLGGAGGRIRGGRVLDYTGKPDRQMCRLFLSLMDKMDQHPASFGDARTMLEEV